MKTGILTLLVAMSFALLTCTHDQGDASILGDIKSLKGLTRKEIRKKIGMPDSAYHKYRFGKVYNIDLYRLHDTEFRYLNDTIQEIVLIHPWAYKFQPEIITDFGFTYRTPDTNDSTAIYSWKNLEGIKTASIYIVRSKKPDSVKNAINIYFDMEK